MCTEKSSWMREMFDSASKKYVLSNTVLTFGMDGVWRRRVVEEIRPKPGGKILDICTGTGDLAFLIARRFPEQNVYGIDYSPKMLSVARDRAKALGLGNLVLLEGDSSRLPFVNGSFDYVTVSFGFRNLSYSQDILKAVLREVHGVLNTGGRFIIIESSQPSGVFIRKVFHVYARTIVPFVGSLFSGRREPYAYLGGSMIKFYEKPRLVAFLRENGFREEKNVLFMFGAILLSIFVKEPKC
ncbi:MAG: ubiquinone/menaquinone biosynthesis methyltransferase [Candidatus Omnitrophica bacterium]|nr:ubiquinone/menaquinone biosynthesis methyltransferase [Candidatus Omnitrophota bacterium]